MNSTYSFADVTFIMSHPSVGSFTFTGQGVGSITISRSNDMTQHDVAADGSVMASKIVIKNGTIALAIQQTSAAHEWLKKWVDYMTVAPTNEWTQTTGILQSDALGVNTTISGISPQKVADAVYQQSGQQETWNLMAMEINN